MADPVELAVLGGGGRLGQELKRQRPEDVLALTRRDCDILDVDSVRDALHDYLPELVIHAAGYTDLPWIETHPEETWACHVEGTLNVVKG